MAGFGIAEGSSAEQADLTEAYVGRVAGFVEPHEHGGRHFGLGQGQADEGETGRWHGRADGRQGGVSLARDLQGYS